PVVELLLRARVERRKRADHAGQTLRQHQRRMRDDEHRRGDDRNSQVPLQDLRQRHAPPPRSFDVCVNVMSVLRSPAAVNLRKQRATAGSGGGHGDASCETPALPVLSPASNDATCKRPREARHWTRSKRRSGEPWRRATRMTAPFARRSIALYSPHWSAISPPILGWAPKARSAGARC